jgi:hypothetical protein
MAQGENIVTDPTSTDHRRHVLPKRTLECHYCGALMWHAERKGSVSKQNGIPSFHICCLNGSVKLTYLPEPPEYLKKLLIGPKTEDTAHFRTLIRLFNSLLSFTSVNCKIDKELIRKTSGAYTYRMQGGKTTPQKATRQTKKRTLILLKFTF